MAKKNEYAEIEKTLPPLEKRKRGRPPKPKGAPVERKEIDFVSAATTNFGLQNLEPGDNSRYLKHALTIRSWPVIEISDPNAVANRIDEYFLLCIQDDMKPSVKGLLNSLRITKNALWEWKQGKTRPGTHQAIILEAYDMLEALWEDYMQNGKINPVSGIFLGKNHFAMQDKHEYVVTPNVQQVSPDDLATIEQKYAELPDGDD